jgi:hypothetical protein
MSPLISSGVRRAAYTLKRSGCSLSAAQPAKALGLVENNLSDRTSILQTLKGASRIGGVDPKTFSNLKPPHIVRSDTLKERHVRNAILDWHRGIGL